MHGGALKVRRVHMATLLFSHQHGKYDGWTCAFALIAMDTNDEDNGVYRPSRNDALSILESLKLLRP